MDSILDDNVKWGETETHDNFNCQFIQLLEESLEVTMGHWANRMDIAPDEWTVLSSGLIPRRSANDNTNRHDKPVTDIVLPVWFVTRKT